VALNVQQQEPLYTEQSAAFIARQRWQVHLSVFLQKRRGRENEITLLKVALIIARHRVRAQINVMLQELGTFEMLPVSHDRMGLRKRENLFFRKALHRHLKFSPRFDALAQVPLHLHLRRIQFLAHKAIVSSVIWFPVTSESGNWVSVEKREKL